MLKPTKKIGKDIESNISYTIGECHDLPAYRVDGQNLTCWELNFWDRIRVLFHGKIWLCISGRTIPPVWLAANENVVFEKVKD